MTKEMKIKKSYEALKEWHRTDTSKGVTTLPSFVAKDCLYSMDMLEKALDKACKMLERADLEMNKNQLVVIDPWTADEWKEWCFDEKNNRNS